MGSVRSFTTLGACTFTCEAWCNLLCHTTPAPQTPGRFAQVCLGMQQLNAFVLCVCVCMRQSDLQSACNSCHIFPYIFSAVLSDRAHPKRMRFTPLVATHTPTSSSTSSSKQPGKFSTPFKAHKMDTTPKQKTVTTTPLPPVWKKNWRKQWVPPSSPCPSSNKSGDDSGLGSSLPGGDQLSNRITEGEDKQFVVTDTQMESFLAATQAPVSVKQSGREVRPQHGTLTSVRSVTSQRLSLITMTGCVRPGKYSKQQVSTHKVKWALHPQVSSFLLVISVMLQVRLVGLKLVFLHC